MLLDTLLHPAVTHAAAFLVGIPFGILLNRLLLHTIDKNYNLKVIFINLVHCVILGLYISSLAHTQWFDGNPPSLIFSGLAAIAFGSLVGEKDLLLKVLTTVLKKK